MSVMKQFPYGLLVTTVCCPVNLNKVCSLWSVLSDISFYHRTDSLLNPKAILMFCGVIGHNIKTTIHSWLNYHLLCKGKHKI